MSSLTNADGRHSELVDRNGYTISKHFVAYSCRIKLLSCQWFSPCSPVSSTNKTDRHDITEILLKVEFHTITKTRTPLIIIELHIGEAYMLRM
jgi:hypothetical protein